jgi:hypothetical protein
LRTGALRVAMNDTLKITEENIALLVNKRLRLWNFSPSHDRLAFEIVPQSGAMPESYLIFVGCDEISTPVFCGIKAPSIIKVGSDLYRFLDSGTIDITFRECLLRADYRADGE